MKEQVDIQQMVSSRDYSWYDKIRAGVRWNKIRVERQNMNRYSIIIIKPKIRSKPDTSKHGKAYNGFIAGIF